MLGLLLCSGEAFWYCCQFTNTQNNTTACYCSGDSCSTDYWQVASCSFVLYSSDCYLSSGYVFVDRKYFWCLTTGPYGACICDPSSPTGRTDDVVKMYESNAICATSP